MNHARHSAFRQRRASWAPLIVVALGVAGWQTGCAPETTNDAWGEAPVAGHGGNVGPAPDGSTEAASEAGESSQDAASTEPDAAKPQDDAASPGQDAGTPGKDAAGSDGGSTPPTSGLRIGLWLSPWVLEMRTPQQWVNAIKGLSNASSYPNRPVVVFGMCGSATDTTSLCQFPAPAGVPSYPNIEYGSDQVTPILDAIEADGTIGVIADVEPMHAAVSDLMHVVMQKYGHYQSIVGFSPDWEWVLGDGDKISKLPSWKDELHGYKAGMEFHLISWMTDSFGDYRDDALSYGCDSQMLGGLGAQIDEFTVWSNHFAPYRSGWYWGYASDADWTRPLCSTPTDLRALQDTYRDINPEGMILMATESLFFEIEPILPSSPMR